MGKEVEIKNEKNILYLVLNTELEKKIEGTTQNETYSPLVKAAKEIEVMQWNVLEFKEYLLSEQGDCFGHAYIPEDQKIADAIKKHYADADANPNKTRVDMYFIPKEGLEIEPFMVRPFDSIADLSDRIIQTEVENIDGTNIENRKLFATVRVQIGLGGTYELDFQRIGKLYVPVGM